MSNSKIYTVIGIMSGTSMDGIDFSLIKTDGKNFNKILFEKDYQYSENYKNRLRKLIKNLPRNKRSQLRYSKKNEEFITNCFIKYIKKFINNIKSKNKNIDLIGLSGQTIFHNPSKGYSIQLADGKDIYKKINIPIIMNFRDNDLSNGGQGAPIGSFYHKTILDRINKNACIINLGGVANITYINQRKIIAYDMGPSNALIDDLCRYFYKIDFDNDGSYGKKGNLVIKIFNKYKSDLFFKKKYPKSLDREHFHNFFNQLIKYKANDAIHTATEMALYGIIMGLKLLKKHIDLIILTGGGRKNLYINQNLKKKLYSKKIKVINIEKLGLNGDMIESQMFGYLAVRSLKGLPISLPSTTGIKKAMTGGVKFGSLIKY